METEKVLMEIQNQLGRIEATTESVKEDISELKAKDIVQSRALEDAYAKAKARQDSIRDDLQHQIDGNRMLITTTNERFNDTIKSFGARIEEVENRKEKVIIKWWDKIIDKLMWLFIIGAMAVLLKWLNAPPEIVNQLPH